MWGEIAGAGNWVNSGGCTMSVDSIADAREKLEATGLHVFRTGAQTLWIAATLRNTRGGLPVSTDACSLIFKLPQSVAVFPAEGFGVYQVPGEFSELVSLIITVYASYRETPGGRLTEAFQRVVPEAEKFLTGSSSGQN
jgi:hypothetical protein